MTTAITKRKDTILASVLDFILNQTDYNMGIVFCPCPCYNNGATKGKVNANAEGHILRAPKRLRWCFPFVAKRLCPSVRGRAFCRAGQKEQAQMKALGWILFIFGFLVIIVPITIAVCLESVPYSLYAIPWTSIGFLVSGWKLAHRERDS